MLSKTQQVLHLLGGVVMIQLHGAMEMEPLAMNEGGASLYNGGGAGSWNVGVVCLGIGSSTC